MKVLSTIICCITLVTLLASCGSSKECIGEVKAGGKTWTAKGKSADDAKRFACNKYCLDTDSKCKAMYDIWVKSPKGKAAGSPPMMRALSEDKQLLDCVTIECANKCLASAKAGKLDVKTNCPK